MSKLVTCDSCQGLGVPHIMGFDKGSQLCPKCGGKRKIPEEEHSQYKPPSSGHHPKKTGASCFPETTNILVRNGYIAISELNKGDEILSMCKQGKFQLRKISHIKKHLAQSIMIISTDGIEIKVTGSHSIQTQYGTQKVSSLQIGDKVAQVSNNKIQYKRITRIQIIKSPYVVYNLIVEKDYTFIPECCVAQSFTYFRKLRVFYHEGIRLLKKVSNFRLEERGVQNKL